MLCGHEEGVRAVEAAMKDADDSAREVEEGATGRARGASYLCFQEMHVSPGHILADVPHESGQALIALVVSVDCGLGFRAMRAACRARSDPNPPY